MDGRRSVVMALGTAALIVAEYTPVFKWLGLPFIPLLELLQVPEAAEASQTLVVGFADMFLPSVLGSGIESEMTRFIIACVSVTQLIYMSEVGGLLLGSKIPVTFLDLVLIFLVRTLITLPVIVLCANFIFRQIKGSRRQMPRAFCLEKSLIQGVCGLIVRSACPLLRFP